MRRVFLMLSAGLVMSVVFASVAMAQTDPSESPYGTLCGSFGSQFGAQQYYDFNATAEEQAIMDPSGDGFACTPEDGNIVVEEITGAPAQDPNAPVGEFSGLTPPPSEASDMVADVADDDMTGLPDTGGPALLLPIAGLALISGGLLMKRRLS